MLFRFRVRFSWSGVSLRRNGVCGDVGIHVVPVHIAVPVLLKTARLGFGISTLGIKSHNILERSVECGWFGVGVVRSLPMRNCNDPFLSVQIVGSLCIVGQGINGFSPFTRYGFSSSGSHTNLYPCSLHIISKDKSGGALRSSIAGITMSSVSWTRVLGST